MKRAQVSSWYIFPTGNLYWVKHFIMFDTLLPYLCLWSLVLRKQIGYNDEFWCHDEAVTAAVNHCYTGSIASSNWWQIHHCTLSFIIVPEFIIPQIWEHCTCMQGYRNWLKTLAQSVLNHFKSFIMIYGTVNPIIFTIPLISRIREFKAISEFKWSRI